MNRTLTITRSKKINKIRRARHKSATQKKRIKRFAFILCAMLCLLPFVETPEALIAGFLFTLLLGNPMARQLHYVTQYALQASVIGLGFGMNIFAVVNAGKEGIIFTVFSIAATMFLGYITGKFFKVNRTSSLLISAGTAICGGSAIAAVGATINAGEKDMSVSLGTVFLLNSVALLLFPILGHILHLNQNQFGLWCAIAIHDTSSVVGAAQKFGSEALNVATAVKLQRALWIIPLTFVLSYDFKKKKYHHHEKHSYDHHKYDYAEESTAFAIGAKKHKNKVKIPYFIFLFVLAALLSTFIGDNVFSTTIFPSLAYLSKRILTATLFLIGAGLTVSSIKSIGIKPLLIGILLWFFISVISIMVIMYTVV